MSEDRLTLAHRVIVRGTADIVDAASDMLRSIDLRTYAGAAKYGTKRGILSRVTALRELADDIRAMADASDRHDYVIHVDGQMPLFGESEGEASA